MSTSRVAKTSIKRAGAVKRTPRFQQAITEHIDNIASPPRPHRQQDAQYRTQRRRDGAETRVKSHRATVHHVDVAETTPPPSINDQQHWRIVEDIDGARFQRPALSIFARSQSLADEQEIQKRLGLTPLSPADVLPHFENDISVDVPPLFKQNVINLLSNGEISMNVARYYLEVVPRGDSKRIPSQKRDSRLLQTLLNQDAQTLGSGWKPVRRLGTGGFGTVFLWQRTRSNGKPLYIATKDTQPFSIFGDYCSEANLTRRLNDLGCKNVINVAEWVFMEPKAWLDRDGSVRSSEAKHRICMEYAERGDLWHLVSWYKHHRLVFPEAFIWHLLYCLANALCYCRRGGTDDQPKPGWDEIRHADVKEENVFLTAPDPEQHRIYPCAKLGDFGMAYTIGVSEPEVQHYKSATISGTPGFMAPEVESVTANLENRPRTSHELHGPQSDIWSLGATFRETINLPQAISPIPMSLETMLNNTIPNPQTQTQPPNPTPPITHAQILYSSRLQETLTMCMIEDPRRRITTHELYHRAKHAVEIFQEPTYRQAAAAVQNGVPGGVYASQVLFTQEDRKMFEEDVGFREAYTEMNHRLLNEKLRNHPGYTRGPVMYNAPIQAPVMQNAPAAAPDFPRMQHPHLNRAQHDRQQRQQQHYQDHQTSPQQRQEINTFRQRQLAEGVTQRQRQQQQEQQRQRERRRSLATSRRPPPRNRISNAVNKIFARVGLKARV